MEELYGFCFRDFGEFNNQTQEMIMGMNDSASEAVQYASFTVWFDFPGL